MLLLVVLYVIINVLVTSVVVDVYRVSRGELGLGRSVPSLRECTQSQWDGVLGRGRHAR